MWPSCESLWRLRACARFRSRSESLTWSARRKRALGVDMVVVVVVVAAASMGWQVGGCSLDATKLLSWVFDSVGVFDVGQSGRLEARQQQYW